MPNRHFVMLWAVAAAAGCGTVPGPRDHRPSAAPAADAELLAHARDVGVLTTVVRRILTDKPEYRVIVDPRPLHPQSAFPGDPHMQSLPTDVIRRRERALRALGVETGDAHELGMSARCPGIMVVALPGRPNPHAGCPRDRRYVVSVGLPQAGNARMQAGEVYDHRAGAAAEGYWAVLVVEASVERGGSVQLTKEYVMRRDARGWTLVKVVGLGIAE